MKEYNMIRIENGYKYYFKGKSNEITALNNINLEFINKGLVLINGTSGSGKSTLLNIISGNEQLDEGSIYPDLNNRLSSFIFQDFKLIEYLSVYDNLKLILDLKKDKDYNKIEKVLNELELINYKDSKVNELSGGQKQRVAIARAILLDYKIILCDEPTGNLDKNNKINIVKILKELSKDKLIIVVSHDIDIWDTYYDQLIKIDDGIIIENKIIDDSNKSIDYTNNNPKLKINYKILFLLFKNNIKRFKIRLFILIALFTTIILISTLSLNIIINNEPKRIYDEIKNIKNDKVTFSKKDGLNLNEIKKYKNNVSTNIYYYDDIFNNISISYNDIFIQTNYIFISKNLNDDEIIITDVLANKFSDNIKNKEILLLNKKLKVIDIIDTTLNNEKSIKFNDFEKYYESNVNYIIINEETSKNLNNYDYEDNSLDLMIYDKVDLYVKFDDKEIINQNNIILPDIKDYEMYEIGDSIKFNFRNKSSENSIITKKYIVQDKRNMNYDAIFHMDELDELKNYSYFKLDNYLKKGIYLEELNYDDFKELYNNDELYYSSNLGFVYFSIISKSKTYEIIMVILLVILLIISIIVLLNTISMNFDFKKKEIGLFKSLYLTDNDISKLFKFDTEIVFGISLLINIILFKFGIDFYNNLLEKNTYISNWIKLNYFSIIIVAIIFIVIFEIFIFLFLRKVKKYSNISILNERC